MTNSSLEPSSADINTANEFLLGLSSISGQPAIEAAFIRPVFRSRQQAFRFAAWLATMAETLPDETPEATHAHSFEEILAAIQNT